MKLLARDLRSRVPLVYHDAGSSLADQPIRLQQSCLAHSAARFHFHLLVTQMDGYHSVIKY